MPQTLVEFLKPTSSLIPDFDGRTENLRSFIDALELENTIKETHEAGAVSLVKAELKDVARNLTSQENAQIVNTLQHKVKAKSVEVLTAKLMNLEQRNKTANQHTKEVEDLTKSLQEAYIADRLTINLASKCGTLISLINSSKL